MRRITLSLLVLLAAAPTLAAAQETPTPPRADTLRPRLGQRMPGRWQMVPRARLAPGLAPRGWLMVPRAQRLPRGQFAPGGRMLPRAGAMGRARFAPGARMAPQLRGPGFAPGVGLLAPGMRERLNLTDEQVKRLEAMRDEVQAENRKWAEQERERRQAQLEKLREERQQLMEQRRKQQEERLERMKQVLTPEQQKQLEELRAQRPRGQRRGGLEQ